MLLVVGALGSVSMVARTRTTWRRFETSLDNPKPHEERLPVRFFLTAPGCLRNAA
jgi:hypothetical protein